MKPELSKVEREQSIKSGFNFTSQLFSKNEVIEKDCNVRNRKRKTR